VRTALEPASDVSYRDVRLDPDQQTITLLRPLVLDLGAIAKGLAIDMAARELQPFQNFAIDAGGDLYLGGHNAEGKPWSVGIRHPRDERELVDAVRVSDAAVCTSGDYERRGSNAAHHILAADGDHHILDPRTGQSATAVASATVVAPSAMVADALATAAFVLGPGAGLDLMERHGVDGIVVTPELEQFTTRGMRDLFDDHAGSGTAVGARDS
jgi:thiamine biosynthesis lipoprotein